jgi:hypothetical protein
MTPEQAIDILEDMAARTLATKREHGLAQQSAGLLRQFIGEKQPAPPDEVARQDEAGEAKRS